MEKTTGLYDLRIPLGSRLSLDEIISRAIRDCFIRHNGKLNKKLMDETIQAVGKRTPQYITTWKDFKENFEIIENKEFYVNPYFIPE